MLKKRKFFDKILKKSSKTKRRIEKMLDFKNKTTFYSDEFVLPKFKPYIRFIEFVFEKSKNPELQKCNLKYIDSLEEAEEILIDEMLKREYCID